MNTIIYYLTQQKANTDNVIKRLNKYTLSRSSVANAFLKFYNSNITFPKILKDGWYEVVKIYESSGISELGVNGGTDFKYGICKVQNNKINEYYENCNISDIKTSFVFQKYLLK